MRTVLVSSAIPDGFDRRRIASLRMRARSLYVLKLLLVCVPFVWCGYLGLDYLARSPRERRFANMPFWGRVVYGARLNSIYAWNWLTAGEDDPKGTRLPVMELYIRRERLEALKVHLPESGRIYQPGLFKVRRKGEPNYVVGANLRFRGDSMNHWAFPQKSWRVKLKGDARYLGMRQFNLYLPRTKSQVPDFLGYQLAEDMGGLVVPKVFPVHLRVNRQFDGMRVFLEQVNEDFFAHHHLSADRLFVGDIDFKDVYAYNDRQFLFQSTSGWEVVPTTRGGSHSIEPIQRLLDTVPLVRANPEKFKLEIERVLDVSGMLRYMAYLEIVNSVHVDKTHNQRLFFDTQTQKLRPIVWDPVAFYRESTEGIDYASNELFEALLQIPEYRDEKNRYVWESLHGSLSPDRIEALIKQGADSIRKEVMASPQKVYTYSASLDMMANSEWSDAVRQLVAKGRSRGEVLLKALQKTSVSATITADKNGAEELAIFVGADAGYLVQELVFESPGVSSVGATVEENGKRAHGICAPRADGTCVVAISRLLASKRFVDKNGDLIRESGAYSWMVRTDGNRAKLRRIRGVNSITKEPYVVEIKRGG